MTRVPTNRPVLSNKNPGRMPLRTEVWKDFDDALLHKTRYDLQDPSCRSVRIQDVHGGWNHH